MKLSHLAAVIFCGLIIDLFIIFGAIILAITLLGDL